MDFITLSLLLGAISLVVFYIKHCYAYWSRRGIPSAKGIIPFFGHMLPVLKLDSNVSMLCLKMYNEYKNYSMIGWFNFTKPVLLIRDPELAKTVLQSNFTSFHENMMTVDPKLDPLLAKNPFFCYGEVWSTGRKRLTHAFSSMRLKILFESVNYVCKKFHDYIERKLKGKDKYEVELKSLMAKFTAEVVANAGFGVEGLCFEEESRPESFDEIGKSFLEPTLANGITQALLFVIPSLGTILQVSFIPKKVDQFFRNIVKSVLESRKTETTQRNDFLQLMSDLEKSQGGKMDEELLTAHALSFYLDGFETSSITLSFIMHQLTMHPDIQEKLREEIMTVLAKYNNTLTYESIKEMTYMEQVISESQRLYPALGILNKVCTEEFELKGSDGLTCRVKPGSHVIICSEGFQKDSTYWTDPETFDPDRFSPERKQDITKFTFLPFGEGPRICVGMRMAMLQMKACLAAFLSNYRVELSPKTQRPLKMTGKTFLTLPIGGLWAYVKRL